MNQFEYKHIHAAACCCVLSLVIVRNMASFLKSEAHIAMLTDEGVYSRGRGILNCRPDVHVAGTTYTTASAVVGRRHTN